MTQVTWRAPEGLVDRARKVAAHQGRSLNEYLTRLVDAATNPELAGTEVERVRERLARAGLLAEPGTPRNVPDPEAVRRARANAGQGTPLSELVSEGRR